MIETIGRARSFLFLVLGFFSLEVSTPAQADQHVVSGCLKLVDVRDYPPPGRGGNNPVDEVEVKIWYTDLLGNPHLAIPMLGSPTLRTKSDGCFDALLTGVPEVTTVRPVFVLNEPDRKVRRESATWRLALPSNFDVTLSAGEAASFGTDGNPILAIDDPDNDANGSLQMWINAEDVVTLYEDAIGPWSSPSLSRPEVTVRYPGEGNNANLTRISIRPARLTSWGVFLHEFGHYFSMWDAATPSDYPAYCVNKTGATWPFSESPYTYEDPDFTDPPCGHKDFSVELPNFALSEGFGDFTRYFLIDDATSSTGARYCSRTPGSRFDDVGGPTDNLDHQHYYNSINFDGEENETNIAHVLCDLVDDEFESVTYLHQFGDEGHINVIDPLGFVPNPRLTDQAIMNYSGSTVGMNSTHTFAAQGTEIFQIEFATGSVSSLFDAATGSDVRGIAADATRVCASDGDTVNCFALATAGPVTSMTLPSGTTETNGIRDLQLSGGDLFLLTNHDSAGVKYVKLHRYDAAVLTWQLVYDQDVTGLEEYEIPRYFAISDTSPTGKVFLAGRRRVEICSVSNCALTSHFAGDAGGTAGYRRGGDASSALFNGIRQLVRIPGGTTLTIVDKYGVSVIEDGDTRLEQWIGRGLDRVFENNLSRRGLVLRNARYASNGTREIVLDHNGTDFAPDRQKINSGPRVYLIDPSIPVTDRYFCAEENVSLDPEDVFTMYDGEVFETTVLNALANYVSLTSAQETAVTETSWINLPPPGNCEVENIRREMTNPSSVGGPVFEEEEECGGYAGPDAADLLEGGFYDAELTVAQHEADENPDPIDESGLMVLTGSDCSGGGEDPNDGDGVCDPFDNCPFVANADQLDTDGDNEGDACDIDDDNDGTPDGLDDFPLDSTETTDTDGDNLGNNADPDDDGDGFTDEEELAAGSDPLDPLSTPDPALVPGLAPAAQFLLFGVLGAWGMRAIRQRSQR